MRFYFNILVAMTGCLLFQAEVSAQSQTNLGAGVAADYEKYKQGQIDKGTMAKSIWDAGNQTRQDLYGKVVDQDGHPVAGVDVTGVIIMIGGTNTRYKTRTDAEGLFQFTGLHGSDIGADVAKEGYEMDYQRAIFKPSDQSTPTNRVVYTMWKLKGAEPMMYVEFESYIPRDGNTNTFDLLSERQNGSGDLMVQLIRDPLEIAPNNLRKPFNWSIMLAITNGGLMEYTNQLYPYEAPGKGYQKTITLNYTTNMVGWQSWAKRDFYFNAKDGQDYGRMTIEVHAGAQTPKAYFAAKIYINPAGSRNLEFDPKKEIMR